MMKRPGTGCEAVEVGDLRMSSQDEAEGTAGFGSHLGFESRAGGAGLPVQDEAWAIMEVLGKLRPQRGQAVKREVGSAWVMRELSSLAFFLGGEGAQEAMQPEFESSIEAARDIISS